MAFNAKRPRINLRQGLDRDVYQILKKLEDANDGKPFKSITAVYDAIKRSNSSLSRQKKRPLEDSIERVLQFRKEELGESSDSEAELDETEPHRPEDERFLLNRQMTKHWNTATSTPPQAQAQGSTESRATKKRRLHEDGEGVSGNEATTPKSVQVNGNADTDAQRVEKEKEKTEKALKKSQKASRYKIETPTEAPQLGGVDEVYNQLRKQMWLLLRRPELHMKNKWRLDPGIIISGPSGIGKKSLIRALAASLEVPIVSLKGCFEDVERMERSLNDAIDEAMRLAPSIIFIDQLDWWMSNPGASSHSDQHRRIVTQFMEQMQRIAKQQPMDRHVIAMATTSRITDVDPAVLKTGFFEWTIQMRIPDLDARKDILKLVTKERVLSNDVDFAELGKITHGFVGADIVNVANVAQRVAIERITDEEWRNMDLDTISDHRLSSFPSEVDLTAVSEPPKYPLTLQDFKVAIKNFTPSLRKEGFTVIPNITWAQVGALQDVREQLDMSIIGPIKDPEMYRRAGLNRPAGCLLWGPPGCGKTLVAQAVANEAQASFILINGPELLNKYVGESERAVRELFNRARSSTPCILFFDEMDSLVPNRDSSSTDSGARVVNALLTELDGAQDRSGVYVIGTTNRPDMIDPAMLRPGRLSVRLFVDLPTADERVDILRAIFRTNHPSATESDLGYLEVVAKDDRCKDYSGADLGGLHVKAAESALKRWRKGEKNEPEIDTNDWENALANTHRSVLNPESYRRLDKKLGASK